MSKRNVNPLFDQPKKIHLGWLRTILLVIVCVVGLPIGFVAALFYDTSSYDTKVNSALEINQLIPEMISSLFDNCRNDTDPSIDLVITEKQLNQLFYGVTQMVKESGGFGDYLRQLNIEIQEDTYTFDLELEAWGFVRTRVRAITTIQSNVMIGANKGFIFKIHDVTAGRVTGLFDALDGMGINLKMVVNMMGSDFPLHLTYNDETNSLEYTYDAFVNDVSNLASSVDPAFFQLFSAFFASDHNYITFTHEAGESINGRIPLAPFRTNSRYCSSDLTISKSLDDGTFYLTAQANKVEEMLNNDIITDAKATAAGLSNITTAAAAMHQFLCFGSDFIDGAEVTFVQNVISENPSFTATYMGGLNYIEYSTQAKNYYFGNVNTDVMDEKISDAIARAQEMSGADEPITVRIEKYQEIKNELDSTGRCYIYSYDDPLTIYDSEIHDMMKDNRQLMGYGFPFVSELNGHKKFSYTMLDNVYVSSVKGTPGTVNYKDEFALVFGLNINQTETSLILPCTEDTYEDDPVHLRYGRRFNISNSPLYYGTEDMSLVKSLISEVMSSVSQVSSWIKFEKDESGDLEALVMEFDAGQLLSNPDFAEFHNHMTSNDPTDIFAQNCTLKVEILVGTITEAEKASDPSIGGIGKFEIVIYYERNS